MRLLVIGNTNNSSWSLQLRLLRHGIRWDVGVGASRQQQPMHSRRIPDACCWKADDQAGAVRLGHDAL